MDGLADDRPTPPRGAAVTTDSSLDWMISAHLSVEDQVKILRSNAERLFEFTPAPFPSVGV
jgi:hypothetical protein